MPRLAGSRRSEHSHTVNFCKDLSSPIVSGISSSAFNPASLSVRSANSDPMRFGSFFSLLHPVICSISRRERSPTASGSVSRQQNPSSLRRLNFPSAQEGSCSSCSILFAGPAQILGACPLTSNVSKLRSPSQVGSAGRSMLLTLSSRRSVRARKPIGMSISCPPCQPGPAAPAPTRLSVAAVSSALQPPHDSITIFTSSPGKCMMSPAFAPSLVCVAIANASSCSSHTFTSSHRLWQRLTTSENGTAQSMTRGEGGEWCPQRS